MKFGKFVASTAVVSFATGSFCGVHFDRLRSRHAPYVLGNDILLDQKSHSQATIGQTLLQVGSQLKFPQIFATSLTVQTPQTSVPVTPQKSAVPSAGISQIMKHGFPSLDNLRSYDSYVLSYDRRNRVPNWVFEHLTRENLKHNQSKKSSREESNFFEDAGIHPYFRGTNDDYKNSGFDRGHMAAAANHRWSQGAMDQTFSLSNVAPQVGKGFNRDAWNQLEKYVRHLTNKYGNVYVCTGPLYLPRKEDNKLVVKYQVIGAKHVAVPTHFFKVLVCETDKHDLDLFSFVMPNQPLEKDVDVNAYMYPIESIERAAGFHLFDKIPRKQFRRINPKKV